MNVFARHARRRLAQDVVTGATIAAYGTQVGWSGKFDVLRRLARAVLGDGEGAIATAGRSEAALRQRIGAAFGKLAHGRRRTREG